MNVPSANQVGHTDSKSRPQLVMKSIIRGLGGEVSWGGSYDLEYINIRLYVYIYIHIHTTTLYCCILTYTIKYGKLQYYYIKINLGNNTPVQYNTFSTVHYTAVQVQCSIV